jgi:hypothetical protein
MGVSGQHHAPAALYSRGKGPRYPLDRRPLTTVQKFKNNNNREDNYGLIITSQNIILKQTINKNYLESVQ